MVLSAECAVFYNADKRIWQAFVPQYCDSAFIGKTKAEVLDCVNSYLEGIANIFCDSYQPAPHPEHIIDVIIVTANAVDGPVDANDYITQAQAAKLLGVTPSRINTLVSKGVLRSHMFGKRHKVFRSDVEDFAAHPRCAGRPKSALDTRAETIRLAQDFIATTYTSADDLYGVSTNTLHDRYAAWCADMCVTNLCNKHTLVKMVRDIFSLGTYVGTENNKRVTKFRAPATIAGNKR